MRRLGLAAIAALVALPFGASARSPAQAFLRSLVVPGWGQRYAGHGAAARGFLGSELALWAGRHAFLRVAADQRDDFRAYAAEHARAQPDAQPARYFDDLGFYASRQEHNLWARYQDGPRAELYPDDGRSFWEWDSADSRLRYRELRNAARLADRRALYVAGAVAVNHVLSAIHAARTVARDAAPQAGRVGLQLHADPAGAGLALVGTF